MVVCAERCKRGLQYAIEQTYVQRFLCFIMKEEIIKNLQQFICGIGNVQRGTDDVITALERITATMEADKAKVDVKAVLECLNELIQRQADYTKQITMIADKLAM